MWETIVVGVTIAAAGLVVIRFAAQLSKTQSGCGGCCGCSTDVQKGNQHGTSDLLREQPEDQ